MKEKIRKTMGAIVLFFGLVWLGLFVFGVFVSEKTPAPAQLIGGTAFMIFLLYTGYRGMFGKAPSKLKRSYENVINLWLEIPPKQFKKIKTFIGNSEAYVAIMEMNLPPKDGKHYKYIVLAGSTGDASIYFESDNEDNVGGWIGGVTHEHIRNASRHFIVRMEEKINQMQPIQEFSHVSAGNVRFTLFGKKGKYAAEFPEADIQQLEHTFALVYGAGQDIMTAFRLLEPNRK